MGMEKRNEEEAAESVVKRLEKHPELMRQIEGLLDEVENRSGELRTADEAEEALIKRMRQIGRSGLSDWAEREEAKQATGERPGAKRGTKKKSGG